MNAIRNVLAATDLSDNARPALKAAATIAELFKADLWVTHVVPPADAAHEKLLTETRDEIAARANQALRDACAELRKSPVKIEVLLEQGDPVTKIQEACRRLSVDVLVAGTRGHGSNDKKSLGGIAERLAHSAATDVLLVRPDYKKKFSNIAVALDFSELSVMALERGAELARAFATGKLTLLHVLHMPTEYWLTGLSEKEVLKKLMGFAKQHVSECTAAVDLSGIKVKEAFNEGNPAEELAKLVKGEGADLLVMGSHGQTGISSAVMGSVASKTVRAVPCSIWIETDPKFKRGFLKSLASIMGLGD